MTPLARLTRAVAQALNAAIRLRGRALLAVSGGVTPRLYLPTIAALPLPWDSIRISLADERFVAADDPQSNAALVRSLLLHGPAAAAEFLAPDYDLGLSEGCADWAARLSAGPWPADALLLGLGADGHIASLFPGSATLSDPAPYCTTEAGAPGRIPRWTLSVAAVRAARSVVVAFAGAEKADAWRRAQSAGAIVDCPAALAASHPACRAFDLG
jgi:6-phosphogluconolactonase